MQPIQNYFKEDTRAEAWAIDVEQTQQDISNFCYKVSPFKGKISSTLKNFDFHDRAVLYTSGITGAVAPIVGAKLLFYMAMTGAGVPYPASEIGSCVGAIITNIIPITEESHLPLPVCGYVVGAAAGAINSVIRKKKRNEKEINLGLEERATQDFRERLLEN